MDAPKQAPKIEFNFQDVPAELRNNIMRFIHEQNQTRRDLERQIDRLNIELARAKAAVQFEQQMWERTFEQKFDEIEKWREYTRGLEEEIRTLKGETDGTR